ncbi:MAG TPA: hypothetical protein VHP36_02895 [Chitinispirillaceae bacterium]|nr:hypothetical protein [Chitinispirillaceae bacterium]
MKIKNLLIVALMIWSSAIAQNDSVAGNSISEAEKITQLEDKLKGLEESYLETKGDVNKLKKIKVSGYVQAQLRVATDTSGIGKGKYKIGKFQGGDLASDSRSVLQIRRGRIKVAYENSYSQMAVQLDCIPKGVSIKDAYMRFSAPWLYGFGIKAGVYDRPFGFEISYSSSSRESPERSRMFQTLFPGERDMGASIEYIPNDNLPSWAQLFNLKLGRFAGNGINDEFDDIRDWIGRFGLSIPLNSINMAIDAGFSGYAGAIRSLNDTLKEMSDTLWVSRLGKKNKEIDRQYFGGDMQIYYGNIPVLGGMSLRGEVIGGQQPGRASSNESPKSSAADASMIYVRNFIGFYTMAVLNIDPLKCQLVGKYDFFDPNIEIEKTGVKSLADASFKTLGLGLVYHWDENVKIMAYFDKITNEEIGIDPYKKDINDNVFTLRIQYKF